MKTPAFNYHSKLLKQKFTKTKINLFILFFAFSTWSAKAQTQLWGLSYGGGYGSSNRGTIFVANGDGSNLQTSYIFDSVHGMSPLGNLVLADNGLLYGVTLFGGYGDSCVIFSYDPITGNYQDVHDFAQNTSTGTDARSGMIKASDGNLYGLCSSGGLGFFAGVIYKLDPTTNTYTDLYNFDLLPNTGLHPYGTLIQLSDGKLYGMTMEGGINNRGIIFSFDPVGNFFTKLYDFNNFYGSNPRYGGLIQATNGKLYGTASADGITGNGVIFSFNLSTNYYFVEHYFDYVTGYNPLGGLIQATDGNLYGLTADGGINSAGSLYAFNPTINVFTNLLNFDIVNGKHPTRGLKQASDGKLYGTTYMGGINNSGVAFSYDIITNTYTKLIDFDYTMTGTNPDCELIETPTFEAVGIPLPSINNPQSAIQIFPNPANNIINILNADKNETLEFTDVLGRELATLKIRSFNKTTFDVSNFPNIFFVKSNSGVQKVMRK